MAISTLSSAAKNKQKLVSETKTGSITTITKFRLNTVQSQTSEKPSADKTVRASAKEEDIVTSSIQNTFQSNSESNCLNKCTLNTLSMSKTEKRVAIKELQMINQNSQINHPREKMIGDRND